MTGCLDSPSYADRYQSVGGVYRYRGRVNGDALEQIFTLGNENLTVDVRRVVNWPGMGEPRLCKLDQQDVTLAEWEGREVSVFGDPYDESSGSGCDVHRDLVAPLNSAAVNIDYFSRVFGDYGRLKVIGQGGTIRTEERSTPSFHYHAKAMDIWWVGWEDQQQDGTVVHTASRPCKGGGEVSSGLTAHRRLVAVEAGLRKWFGTVLNRNIDGHDNHFHVDIGCPVALRVKTASSRGKDSAHFFLQDCIVAFTDFTDEEVPYDGDWGPKSKKGYEALLSDLGMECLDPIMYVSHYMLFLDYIMMHGFADKPAGTYRWGDRVLVLDDGSSSA
ncbi:MAG: hypothetical protein OXI96_06280 [Acidimicrobiaceae bacterium]|nr:hypothetical protein [Acidimicrobiaceae bacterium]